MTRVDVGKAHEELIEELFETGAMLPYGKPTVRRSYYTEAMHKIQDKYGLKQGHPDFLEWVFTCIGRSPMIIEDEEKGAVNDESTDTN